MPKWRGRKAPVDIVAKSSWSLVMMALLLDLAFPLLGATVTALVIWQGVALFNRRPNRRVLIATPTFLGLSGLYVASFGPAYWWLQTSPGTVVPVIYSPLVEAGWHAPRPVILALGQYASWRCPDNLRLGCAPLWSDGPRAFSWTTIDSPPVHYQISVPIPHRPLEMSPTDPPGDESEPGQRDAS